MARLVEKAHKLISAKRERRVRPAVVIAEFDFVHSRPKTLDNGPDLPPNEPLVGHIFEKSNHGQRFDFSHDAA